MRVQINAIESPRRKKTGGKSLYNLETIPLHCSRALGNFQNTDCACSGYHMNVAEEATQFWRKVLSWTDVMSHI